VRLLKLGADGLEFSVQFWIADPHNGQVNVRSDLNLLISRPARAGIESRSRSGWCTW
jgi:small-conductance mechanosensitive channel